MTKAFIKGIITKINDVVYLENGDSIRNVVVACNLKNQLIYHDIIIWNELNKIEIKKSNEVCIYGDLKYKKKDLNKYSEIIANKIKVIK
jgi:hypothetical protein